MEIKLERKEKFDVLIVHRIPFRGTFFPVDHFPGAAFFDAV